MQDDRSDRESEEKGGVSLLASAHLIRITFFSWKPSHSPPTLPLGPFNCLLVSVGGLLHSNTIALQGQSLYPLFFFSSLPVLFSV